MRGGDQALHLGVHARAGLRAAHKRAVGGQVGIVDRFQRHHAELVAHAVAGNHGAGDLRGLFDVVARAGGDGAEHHFLGGAAAGEGGQLAEHVLAAHEHALALFNLHGVAQRAGGARNNGDLVHGSGVLLTRRNQRVADLVVGDDLLFLLADDRALALVARDDDLHALLQIRLAHGAAAHAHGAQGGLVDDVGQLRAAGAAGGPADGVEIDVRLHLHVLGVHLEDGDAALQVGKLDGDAPVEAAGAQEGLVQAFGAVGRGQDDHALGAVKAVHLGEQLVEGLLALVVAADAGRAVALFADGVDLVNKHDARGLIRGLLEEVAHLGRAHAHEHLHKLAAGDGEKRHLSLARDGLGQKRLARARRAYE